MAIHDQALVAPWLPGPRERAQTPSGGGEKAPACPAENVSHLTLREVTCSKPGHFHPLGQLRWAWRRRIAAFKSNVYVSLFLTLAFPEPVLRLAARQKEMAKMTNADTYGHGPSSEQPPYHSRIGGFGRPRYRGSGDTLLAPSHLPGQLEKRAEKAAPTLGMGGTDTTLGAGTGDSAVRPWPWRVGCVSVTRGLLLLRMNVRVPPGLH